MDLSEHDKDMIREIIDKKKKSITYLCKMLNTTYYELMREIGRGYKKKFGKRGRKKKIIKFDSTTLRSHRIN
jgi:hypothetical protein